MWLDQWFVQKIAQVFYWRYGTTLKHESHKWALIQEENRIERLKAELASCGEDVVLRDGANILVPQKVRLGHHVAIGHHSLLRGLGGITIGNFVLLGDHVILATSSHPTDEVHYHNYWEAPITLHDNVWLGAGVLVMPGVTIGKNSVIGAGAVVTEDIPANSVAVGMPAKVIKTLDLDPEAITQQMRAIRTTRITRQQLTSEVEDIF